MVYASILFGEEARSLEQPERENLKAPTVYTGQRVRGVVRIYHDERLGPMFDTVQVLLKGQVSNVITLDGICWRVEKPLVRMSCVKNTEDFQEKPSNVPYTICSQSKFFFDIPEFITLPSSQDLDSKKAFQPLPPSIRVVKKASSEWLVGKTTGICDVTYHVQTRFFKQGRAVSETQREIIMMPVAEIPPPMDADALKAEYIFSATSAFTSFWKPKQGTLLIGSSIEPPPFVMYADKRKSRIPGTDLQFDFLTRNILGSRGSARKPEPQFTTCELIMTLEATTYFQEREKESVMSLVEAQKSQLAVLKTVRYQPQIRKTRLESWKKVGLVTAGSNRLVEWNTSMSVKALIPYDAPRLPSFFSTLVSRRYAFDVEIRFGTDLGIKSQKPMKLKIPVQFVHAGLEKGWGWPPEIDFEEDSKVPAYVP